MGFSDLFDYLAAAIDEETDVALRIERRDELDRLKRHVAPAPPVVLTEAERAMISSVMFRSKYGRDPKLNCHDVYSDRFALSEFGDALDAVLAWFAANGITLTREARP